MFFFLGQTTHLLQRHSARGQFEYSKLRDEKISKSKSLGRGSDSRVTRPAPGRPPDPVFSQPQREAVLIDFASPPPAPPTTSHSPNTSLMDEPIDIPEEGDLARYQALMLQ